MVWQFIDVFKRVAGRGVEDDDFADRLTHRHTVTILIIFCILVGSSQFVGSPIACWVPAHFSGSMTSYTNNICWIANSYFVPLVGEYHETKLPGPNEPGRKHINYYQWVPFILVLMAALCYAPFAVWRVLSKQNNVNSKSVMKIISSMDQSNAESREKSIRTVCKIIDRSIEINRDYHDGFLGKSRKWFNHFPLCLPSNKSGGNYLICLYFFIKVIYMSTICGQFFLLNSFMGSNYNIYGFQVLNDFAKGKDFWESPRFPRITMCDFTIRTLGENNQKNTIQCTLPINLFNEKIFIFIWFWYAFVAAVTFYSFIVWLFNTTPRSRSQFVRRYLNFNDHLPDNDNSSGNLVNSKLFENFICLYLKQDGALLLRIVKKNTNDLIVGELICSLWEQYKRNPKHLGDKEDSMVKEKLLNNGRESLLSNGYHHNP